MNLAGEKGFEPLHAGIKIQCLNQLGDSPTRVDDQKSPTDICRIRSRERPDYLLSPPIPRGGERPDCCTCEPASPGGPRRVALRAASLQIPNFPNRSSALRVLGGRAIRWL